MALPTGNLQITPEMLKALNDPKFASSLFRPSLDLTAPVDRPTTIRIPIRWRVRMARALTCFFKDFWFHRVLRRPRVIYITQMKTIWKVPEN